MTDTLPSGATSAGALLRAARERQGLHIAALAAAIKVTPRKLDALENDRWSELPDATFTRALAQTVCRSLKIDAKPVLELLPPAETVALEFGGGSLNEPFSERGARNDAGWAGAAIKPMVALALLLLLAALVIQFAPQSWWPGGRSTAPAPTTVTTPVLPAASADAAPVASPALAAASAPAAVQAAAAAPAARVETVFSAPPAGAAASAMPVDGALQLRAGESSWVEVRDGRGRVLISRTVQRGEAVGLDGELPLRLVVGNAGATQLSFRGRPVDLAPHTRDSVARLELK